MASDDAKNIPRVAIPATYWNNKDIQNEPWFDIRHKMFYAANIVEWKEDWSKQKYIFKAFLEGTNEVEWLSEENVLKYDFEKKPLNGILVSKYICENESEEEDDVNLKHLKRSQVSKKPQANKDTGYW